MITVLGLCKSRSLEDKKKQNHHLCLWRFESYEYSFSCFHK